jgi:hypothetical protein
MSPMSSNKQTVQNLNSEELCNLAGFFELLIKVDKRVNTELYVLPPKKLLISNPPLLEITPLQCKEL